MFSIFLASQCLGVTGSNTTATQNRGKYDWWSYQSRASQTGYALQCCCKNIKNGVFRGNQVGSIMGDSKCLGAGRHSPWIKILPYTHIILCTGSQLIVFLFSSLYCLLLFWYHYYILSINSFYGHSLLFQSPLYNYLVSVKLYILFFSYLKLRKTNGILHL